ncbi:MAG: guanylate kinase [Myxococcota bacterium]|nr:guanylate kinase [Myxococcota bacterium]
MNKGKAPLLLIVSSPSGAGKTTLCHKLLAEFDDLKFSVSHTTRQPRPNEVDGKDYYFVSNETFDEMLENDLFIEWAHVHGNRYGTSRAEIRTAAVAGRDLLFDVDFQGARKIREQYPDAVGLFVLPPSIEVLRNRLAKRGTETAESLERRFKAALDEIRTHDLFDYLLVNRELDIAYDQLRAVLIAERIRQSRVAYVAQEMIGL